MIGLRKVVNLKIYDVPNRTLVVNKEEGKENNFRYSRRNTYYIGNTEIYKSRRFNNTKKKPMIASKCNDEYLRKMTDKITKTDENLEENLNECKDFICYENNDSSITYFGEDIDLVKNKVLLKTRKNK